VKGMDEWMDGWIKTFVIRDRVIYVPATVSSLFDFVIHQTNPTFIPASQPASQPSLMCLDHNPSTYMPNELCFYQLFFSSLPYTIRLTEGENILALCGWLLGFRIC